MGSLIFYLLFLAVFAWPLYLLIREMREGVATISGGWEVSRQRQPYFFWLLAGGRLLFSAALVLALIYWIIRDLVRMTAP